MSDIHQLLVASDVSSKTSLNKLDLASQVTVVLTDFILAKWFGSVKSSEREVSQRISYHGTSFDKKIESESRKKYGGKYTELLLRRLNEVYSVGILGHGLKVKPRSLVENEILTRLEYLDCIKSREGKIVNAKGRECMEMLSYIAGHWSLLSNDHNKIEGEFIQLVNFETANCLLIDITSKMTRL